MPLASILITVGALLLLGVTTLFPAGRLMLATAAADVIGWVLWLTARIGPTVAVQFAQGLVRAFEQDRETWAAVVQVFTNEITTIVGAGGSVSAPTVGGAGTAAANIAQPLSEAVIKGIAPPGELTPEQGQTNLENLLGLMFALGLQGWWVEAVGDLISLGKFGAAADLPDAIERSLGLSRLGRLAWRTPIKKAIAEPLEELYNRRYGFKKLTLGEAGEAWHKGLVDDATFLDAAAAAGYSHDRAAILLGLRQQNYSTAEVEDLSRLLAVPDDLAIALLREAGWDSGRASTLLQLTRARQVQKALDELAVQARKLYQTGRLTQGQLTSILEEAHFPPAEVGIILATEDLVRAEAKQLTVSEIQAALRDGALDPGPARQRLRALGYQDEDVDLLLTVRGKQPSSGQIIDAVVRARITPEEGQARLVREGYSAADAELLVSLRARRLSEGQVVDALRANLITAQQGRVDLQALGFPGDVVDILLAFVRRVLSPADVQAALLRGLLSDQDARARLTEAGYTPADAEIIIDLRRRLLLPGQILDAFEDGFITRVEALSDLEARGLSAEDALLVVRVFELRATQKAARAAAAPPAGGAAPPRRTPPSGGRRGTGGTPPAPPPP